MMGEAQRAASFVVPEAEDDLPDLSAFKPAPRGSRPKVDLPAARADAARLGFKSREPRAPAAVAAPAEPDPAPRRGRLQRAAVRKEQLNLRANSETVARFVAIAEARKWMLGDTFDEAVQALEEKLASNS